MPRNQKSMLGTRGFTCWILSAYFLATISFRPGSIGAQEGEMAESRVGVSLEQLDEISSECLESLVTTMFRLKLGLKEIGYEQAEVLARYRGRLILTGLRTMTDEQAELFAAREGTLRLSRALADLRSSQSELRE